jgi:hypothetical protein
VKRRKFIQLLGGGTVLAAAGTTAGLVGACSVDYPDAAVAAWRGPSAEIEVRRWALSYALLAPNSHNRQPWIADIREPNVITLYVDRERLLPMTDPWFRQIVVSQGTFIESLVIALRERGIDPQVQLFPDGEFKARELDERPVARVTWQSDISATAPVKDPLFAQLLRRHTAKVAYDTSRPVAPELLDELRRSIGPRVNFAGTVDSGKIEPLRRLCLESAKVELSTERTIMESLRLTRVGPAEIAQYRDGISINEWLPRLAVMLGEFDRSKPPAPGSVADKKSIERFEQHSLTAMGFVWLSTPTAQHMPAGTGRSAEVNAGRAYMRLQLKATELGLQVHPMSQAPQEFPEMKVHYDALHQVLLGKPATEETVQMFCRIGYCPEQQHTPRRPLDSILRI